MDHEHLWEWRHIVSWQTQSGEVSHPPTSLIGSAICPEIRIPGGRFRKDWLNAHVINAFQTWVSCDAILAIDLILIKHIISAILLMPHRVLSLLSCHTHLVEMSLSWFPLHNCMKAHTFSIHLWCSVELIRGSTEREGCLFTVLLLLRWISL